jgi:hypothetical protein
MKSSIMINVLNSQGGIGMKALRMTLMVVAIVALAGSAMAQNTVYVQGDGTGAMNGTNFGLTLDLDGTTSNAFVEDQTPADETIYRASFWFDPNSLPMNPADKFVIFLARHSSFNNVLRLQFNFQNGNYRVRLQVKKNNNVWADCRLDGATGVRFITIGDEPTQITIESVFGDSTVALARVTANGVTHFKDTYQSSAWSVARIRMGGPRMAQAQGGPFVGEVYFDEFESYRTLAP